MTTVTDKAAETIVIDAADEYRRALAEARQAEAELWAAIEDTRVLADDDVTVTGLARTLGVEREGFRRRTLHLVKPTDRFGPCERPGCDRPQQWYIDGPFCNVHAALEGAKPLELRSA